MRTFTAAEVQKCCIQTSHGTQLNLIISMPFLRQLLGGEMLGLYWVALFVPGLWPFLTVWVRATGQLPCSVCLVFMCLQWVVFADCTEVIISSFSDKKPMSEWFLGLLLMSECQKINLLTSNKECWKKYRELQNDLMFLIFHEIMSLLFRSWFFILHFCLVVYTSEAIHQLKDFLNSSSILLWNWSIVITVSCVCMITLFRFLLINSFW